MREPRWRRAVLMTLAVMAASAFCGASGPAGADDGGRIMVATAMSLRQVLPALIEAFRKQSPGSEVVATYGASGDLRRQVEGGAPIDVVVFAAASDVDLLIDRKLIAGGKRVVASNSLLLIGPKDAEPLTFHTIDQVPAGDHIAIGDPKTVPAGRYAREVLQALNKWDAVQDRLVFGGHVAAVLQYARRGEVAAAVVYGTDILGVDGVVVLDRARGDWAPRIETVAAVVAGGQEAAGCAFLDYLETPAAGEIFSAHGFGPPGGTPADVVP
jgi:molybdate transport system substrate-binding protein